MAGLGLEFCEEYPNLFLDHVKLLEYAEGDFKDEFLLQLKTIYCDKKKLDWEHIFTRKVISQVEEAAEDSNDYNFNVNKYYKNVLEKAKENSEFDDESACKELHKIVKRFTKSGEDDVIETQATVNTVDPFTKKTIENPVKNVHCGHTYDLNSVTSMLNSSKRKKHLMCPYLGCGNKVPIKTSDLVDDELALKKIRSLTKTNQSKRN